MKGHLRSLPTLVLLASTQAMALTDNAKSAIVFIDKPYTITHLDKLNVDCVWTRGDNGYLNSEASAPDGTGVCWDISAVKQVEKLDKEGKLEWHNPPEFTHEYGDKNTCYYRVDKVGGFVDFRYGDNAVEQCGDENLKAKALKNATPIKQQQPERNVSDFEKLIRAQINACYAGAKGTATGDWSTYMIKYATITDQFKGNGGAISRIGRAFDYGKMFANTPNDCVNYVTGLR